LSGWWRVNEGSDKIRGLGFPEGIEAILLRGARVEPRLAVLKPVSAAIAIGSGGPFGAEGIIMTGGAAAGMSATFASPFAAILLA
jgi:chloride channel protein, CIC family